MSMREPIDPNDNGDKELNISSTYTSDNQITTGNVVDAKYSTEIGKDMISEGISLGFLHQVYEANDNSGEAAYKFLVDALKENKDNPLYIKNTVGTLLAEFDTKYDSKTKHGQVGKDQGDYLATVFSTERGEETSALICGTIHNFVRDALQDAGIEAVTVIGGNIPDKKENEFTNHACLLFKNSDGTYTFNNYGKSATIEAGNIKDALYTVHKEAGLLDSGGQITLHDKNGSYQEFALSKSSAFGRIIDKKDYNNVSLATNPVADRSSIDVKTDASSVGNISASASVTNVKQTENDVKSQTIGIEVKKSDENAEFYNSSSIGVMADQAKTKQISDNTALTTDIKAVYSHTKGELGGAVYDPTKPLPKCEPISKPGGDISYETLMTRSSVTAQTNLTDNNRTQVSNLAGASLQGYGVIGHSNHYSSSYDGRFTLEDGVEVTSENLTGNVTGGLIVDLNQHNNGAKPTIGSKLNLGIDYSLNPDDNWALSMQARGYGVFTQTSTETGAQGNLSATWNNPNPSAKIDNIWINTGVGIENQNLHIGNIKETTDKSTVFNVSGGMNIGQRAKLSISYSQYNNLLNSSKNQKQIMANFGYNFQ